jgi:hypothetical protein
MKHRPVIAAAIIVSLVGAGAAEAKKAPKHPALKPVCNLVPGNNSSGLSPTGGGAAIPGDSSDSITSADIASNATTLTAVVRVAGLQNPDPESPLGTAYYFYFTVPGNATLYFLTGRLYPTGNLYYFGYEAPDPLLPLNTLYAQVQGTGVVDTAHNQVRISVPLSAIASLVKLPAGTKLTSLEARTYRILGQGVVPSQNVGPGRVPFGGLSETFDDVTSANTYTMGTPSCVPVGH